MASSYQPNPLKSTLSALAVTSPALGALGLGAAGAFKAFNSTANKPTSPTSSLSQLGSLGSAAGSAKTTPTLPSTPSLTQGMNAGVNSGGFGGGGGGSFGDTGQSYFSSNSNYSSPSYSSSYSSPSYGGSNYDSTFSNPSLSSGGNTYDLSQYSSPQQSSPQTPSSYSNPYADQLKALQDKINSLNDSFGNYLKPSQEELDTQSQLDALRSQAKNLNASEALGLAQIQGKPIALPFQQGQSAALQRQVAAQMQALSAQSEPLTTQLARLQSSRQNTADLAKYQLENIKSQYANLESQNKPIEVGGNLIQLNPQTGKYETVFSPNQEGGFKPIEVGQGSTLVDPQTGRVIYQSSAPDKNSLTDDIREFNLAQSQGFNGSFVDFKRELANLEEGRGGANLPAAYREYQLSQNDPGFAQYLNRNQAGGGGRPLTDTQAKLISEGNQLSLSLQPLYSLVQNQSNLFGPVAGRIGGANPFNTAATTAKSQLKTAAQLIGSYLEQGKLTDADVPKYEAILPQLTDTPAVAKNKLDNIGRLIEQKKQQYLQDFGSAGYNTSGFGRQTQGGVNSGDPLDQALSRLGFKSPLSMGLKGSVEQKFPQGANGGQCAHFARQIADIPPLGNGLNDKRAHVDKIGVPAQVWKQNPQIGDVIISNDNPTYGHVAVVNEVLPNGMVRVTESNYHGDERVTHNRLISINSPRIYGAIHARPKV